MLGVAPNRDGFSAAETASAIAGVASQITRADGSTAKGGSFEYGLAYNGNGIDPNFNPKWTIDSMSTSVRRGTLEPGDAVDFIYQLTAQGTTNGGERGYDAFRGDPCSACRSSATTSRPTQRWPYPSPAAP